MKKISKNILGTNIEITKTNIKIKNSNRVNNLYQMKSILFIARNIAKKENIIYKRSVESWVKEWKAHNLLYKLHLFRNHTLDTDLSENESKFRLFIYDILGR